MENNYNNKLNGLKIEFEDKVKFLMSENLTFKYKINDLVVDIDSKEEVIDNLMKNNEGKLNKLNKNET